MKTFKSGAELGHIATIFEKIPFPEGFKKRYLHEILESGKMVRYSPEEIIIAQGDIGNEIYVLLAGKVRVVKDNKTISCIDEIGDIFGEMALMNEDVRSASVIAEGIAWCLVMEVSFLRKLPAMERGNGYAVLYGLFAKIVGDRLKLTSEELVETRQQLEAVQQELEKLRKV